MLQDLNSAILIISALLNKCKAAGSPVHAMLRHCEPVGLAGKWAGAKMARRRAKK